MATQPLESSDFHEIPDGGYASPDRAGQLGEIGLAQVIDFPVKTPTMTEAMLRWSQQNNERGHGMFGSAAYRHDDEGKLYINNHGRDLYLT